MATVTSAPDQRVALRDVSWQTYEALLTDNLDNSAPRFTYDRGELEILSPSTEHERVNRTIALLVEEVALELGIEVNNVGSMTFKRRDLERGFEPDSSFYIQHEADVRDKPQIDLTVDPPPDLIIEIEISRSAIPKLPIYAALGVPEVWRWDGERVTMQQLTATDYVVSTQSAALPRLRSDDVTRLLLASQTRRRTVWLRELRAWASRALD